jgi:hypothetical protein
MTDPQLTLFSSGLLSKWGFWDGMAPDDWLDYCEARGVDYTRLPFPLTSLVRRYLLPQIEQAVTVVEIDTCHNPVRAATVDLQDMTDVWTGRVPEPLLTPEHVDVSMADALRIALTEAGLAEAPRYSPPLPYA